MSKARHVYNIPDFKDSGGNWTRSYYPVTDECHHTRSYLLWTNINNRCKVGGAFQKVRPSYTGTTNVFTDFQEFSSWCQDEYGYMNKDDSGKYWNLDKDLIKYGNKEYSKDKCIFVPQRINTLLISSATTRGEYPLGVFWDKQRKKLVAMCNNGRGRQQYLGVFTDKMEAHQAWQKYKIQLMKNILLADEEVKHHLKLVPIIEQHIQRIQDDLANGSETL